MKKLLLLLLLLLALLWTAPLPAAEPKLPEQKLRYYAAWNGMSLGEVVVSLKAAGEANCYRYESRSDPAGVVRMFYGKPHEVSEFCVEGGRVVPRRFAFVKGKDDEENFELAFDMKEGRVRGGDKGERTVPPHAQDRFGLQQAVRLWVIGQAGKKDADAETVEFAMVDERRIKIYRFAITAREPVEVPAGRFDTVRVERVDDKRKSSRFWLAPKLDYMPVRVEQVKGDEANLRMELLP